MKKNFDPVFSICIPAYQRVSCLKRLLDSIVIQKFRDFEVVVTDDSPSDEVAKLCNRYESKLHLRYFKNSHPLGTPENWNQAIKLAKGEWIKIMHDDDWFAHEESLTAFADAVLQHPGKEFFFSAFRKVFEASGKEQEVFLSTISRNALQKNPAILFSKNLIGPPSVLLHKNNHEFWYDNNLKWVVDIDFYIRYLGKHNAVYIPDVQVNVGMHAQQVTKVSFRNPEVEIPENFYLLNKVGTFTLRNITVFDAWWRLIRNLNIRDVGTIRKMGYKGEIPSAIVRIIRFQKFFPKAILRNGVFSKILMFVCFLGTS